MNSTAKIWYDQEKDLKMDYVSILTAFATAVTVIGFVYGFLRNFKSDIQIDISRLDVDIKDLGNKVEADMRAQTARTDKLYEMFIEMQNKMDQGFREADKKFYDSFREIDKRFREVDKKFYELLKDKTLRTDP